MQMQCKLPLKQLQREYLKVTYEVRGKYTAATVKTLQN